MKNTIYPFLFILCGLFTGCIKDDIIEDFVEPVLRISQTIDTLGFEDSFTFQAQFFNNVGQSEDLPITWSSSNPSIISIDDNGTVTGLQPGEANITAQITYEAQTYTDEMKLVVGMETIIVSTERTGTIAATSFYELTGDFTLKVENDILQLSFDENYVADDGLPGLYVYLTNNPNTTNGALEIGRVTTFNGAHSYEIPSNPDLNDFQYVLYFCKPFNVKVGDGEIAE